jgi:DNA (cytosine-5)-methyltransferase 1
VNFTAFAEYILMSPSECYAPFMDVMMAKIQLSKLVIEFLTNSPDATYEDLLNHLQTAPPLNGQIGSFSEDALLRHSQFIVDQVGQESALL